MTDNGLAALGEALRAILSDFDREPDDEYMAVAVPMFLSLLPPDWCGHKTAVMLEQEAEAHESTIAALRAALDGLVEAARPVLAIAAISYEGDPWFVDEEAKIEDAEGKMDALRAALAAAKGTL